MKDIIPEECEECDGTGWTLIDIGDYEDMAVRWTECWVCENPFDLEYS